MDRHKGSSQTSIDKKSTSTKESLQSINKQNYLQSEIDNLVQHGILDPIYKYDRKLHFTCAPVVTRDQVLKQTRRQTCSIIWKSIQSPTISKLVRDDRSYGFVEILHTPTEWSRYDEDILLIKIRHRRFLNGLALRDEFYRVLHIVLKRDFNEDMNTEKKFAYDFKALDFTRNTIQLVFMNRFDPDLSLVLSFVIAVEFDIPCTEFFPDTLTSLCHHNEFDEYFKSDPDVKRARFTPYNTIKFAFDYSLTEARLCEFILQKSSPLSSMLTSFLKLRKESIKYVQRASKYATETIRIQAQSEKHRQSTCSVNSGRSGTSNASNLLKSQSKVPLSTEIEVAVEYLFSVSLMRLLFLTVCAKYKQFGAIYENDTAYAIEKSLQLLGDGLERDHLEHPFFKSANVLPESFSTHEMSIRIGMKRLVKEMQRDWKRNIRR